MDPALLQSFRALSKASLSNAETIYQEAKKDFMLNTSLPTAKRIQTQNKEIDLDKSEQGRKPTQQEATSISQSNQPKNEQNTIRKNNSNTEENWSTNTPSFTMGSSERISPPDFHRKKFKHSTPPSATSEDEEVEVVSSPTDAKLDSNKTKKKHISPKIRIPPGPRIRLRSSSRQPEL